MRTRDLKGLSPAALLRRLEELEARVAQLEAAASKPARSTTPKTDKA